MLFRSGKGKYTDESLSVIYRILPAGKDISKASFKIKTKEYIGRSVKLTSEDITAVLSKKGLTLGTDYEITAYTNNVKKGTATVTFRGIGEYGGTKTVKFKITQRNIGNWWQGILGLFH